VRLTTLYLPEFAIEKLDALVKKGLYPNRAEAIRCAVHDLVQQELDQELKLEKVDVDIREAAVEISENGRVHTVELKRDKDGSIWGVYPDKPQNIDCVFTDGMRNLLILFRKGILKLEDFPRQKFKEALQP
jgi:Arc/MetJ-type ribon-helix-helix transcriptional regulator